MLLNFLFNHTPLFYFVQSFWRDEAFSVILAQFPLTTIIAKSSMEPPVFYVLLHFWIKLFGTSEIAARSLSLVGFALATVVVIEWADILFKRHWLSKFMPLFFFFNPMLLYYAFEVRAYGWYIFFAVLSMFAYDQKKWKLYCVAVILGLYTHLYLGMIPLVYFIHYIWQQKLWRLWRKPADLLGDPMIRSLAIIGFCFIPWIIRLAGELQKFKESWYYPVDLNLIQSVLGNMFLGYEGTPWYFWIWTKRLSLVLAILFGIGLVSKTDRKHTVPLFLMIIVPLTLTIGFSFIKPIFVNRYCIPVTIAETLLLCFTIKALPNEILQKTMAGMFLIGILIFNCWYPQEHKKLNIRKTFEEIQRLQSPQDLIVAADPMVFMETMYYTKDKQSVRLYNPMNIPFPWYIGSAVFSPSYQISSFPMYPRRAFLVQPDGTFSIGYTLSDKK